MKFTKEQFAAADLWRVAEGRPDLEGNRPSAFQQREAQFKLGESVASGDFPVQILPAVRRTTQAVFDSVETQAEKFTTRKTVQAIDVEEELNVYAFGDQSKLEGVHMGSTFVPGGLPRLGPREKYPTLGLTASGKKISAGKFGEAFGMDWEAIVRQRGTNVNLIRDGFTAFGEHAKNQNDIVVANLMVDGSGFRTGSGLALNAAKAASAANGFSVNNADLSNPEDFQKAIALSNTARLTVGSGTVSTIVPNYTRFVLLTTPEQAPRLRQALQARRVLRVPARTGAASATTGTEWEETIDLGGTIDVIGWEWLKRLFPTIGKGWILVPVATGATDLPVFTQNFLEGYEAPQIFIRNSNSTRIGGGPVDAQIDGDFDSDAVETKVRHVVGANFAWTDGVVYSLGTNS